jgi:hypothetical protein
MLQAREVPLTLEVNWRYTRVALCYTLYIMPAGIRRCGNVANTMTAPYQFTDQSYLIPVQVIVI